MFGWVHADELRTFRAASKRGASAGKAGCCRSEENVAASSSTSRASRWPVTSQAGRPSYNRTGATGRWWSVDGRYGHVRCVGYGGDSTAAGKVSVM